MVDQGTLLNIGKFLSLITIVRGVEEVLIHLPSLFILNEIAPYDKNVLNLLSLMIRLIGTLLNIYICVGRPLFYIFLFLPLLIGFKSFQLIFWYN